MKAQMLPDREEMLKRLITLDDSAEFQQNFYPKLLKDAGRQKPPIGIVLGIQLAILDYTHGMPAQMVAIMMMKVPDLIRCMSPNDEFTAAAIENWKGVIIKGENQK